MKAYLSCLALVALHAGPVLAAEPAELPVGGRTGMVFLLLFAILIVSLMYFMRLILRLYRKDRSRQDERDSQMSFMVNTFHELVQKLKEKERELEELRSLAEERADNIESYNENILQSVPSGVVSFDSELRITRINAAAERILSVRAADFTGRHYTELFSGRIADLIRERESLVREEVIYESPRTKRLWLGLNISPLKNRKGEPIGRIIVFTDLTDLKALEAQMRLRENLTSLGEMSAGIAHELRNPMGVIAGHTRILSRKVPPELMGNVESIKKEIEMMDRIITDFMSFAHPLHLNRTQVDVASIIEECVSQQVDESGPVSTMLELGPCIVEADETLLRQVFTNLFANAVEAMREGGELSIHLDCGSDSVTVRVRDTGHGISDEMKGKVFLPFYTTKEKGTGLGLAIVHKIIVSHGGSISFDSSAEGTVFTVTLPLSGR